MTSKQGTFPGMLKREMPKTARVVDMSQWKESPLYRTAIEAERKKSQRNLFENIDVRKED